MLSHVAIKNFKSIGEPGVELELKPLTILVGPNGSGKSSILEGLYFFRPDGTWGRSQFTREELFHKQDTSKKLVINVSLKDARGFETSASAASEITRVRVDDRWFDAETPTPQYERIRGGLRNLLESTMFFISALRGDVPRGVPPTESVLNWTGPKGEFLLHILNVLNEPENLDKKKKVERWAGEFGTEDIWAGLRRASVTSSYRDMGTRLSGLSASYGARQILPVVANLFYCPPGSTFLIEEPEISLHPEAQVKLVEMFAEAIKQDKQIIITTHSHYLLLAVTEAIRREWIKSDAVAIWEITKEEERGTVAKQLPITEEGVIKGWVSSFAKVDAQLLKGRTRPASRVRR
jgi:predicted ATPase